MSSEHPIITKLRANLRVEPEVLLPQSIAKLEEKHNAKYICDTTIKDRRGYWHDQPCAIFYTPVAHPEGSNWFAIFKQTTHGLIQHYIANGISAVETPFVGVVAKNGDVIYSRYGHDFRTSPDGSVSIDGGREYTRFILNDPNYTPVTVSLQIIKDRLEIINDPDV